MSYFGKELSLVPAHKYSVGGWSYQQGEQAAQQVREGPAGWSDPFSLSASNTPGKSTPGVESCLGKRRVEKDGVIIVVETVSAGVRRGGRIQSSHRGYMGSASCCPEPREGGCCLPVLQRGALSMHETGH